VASTQPDGRPATDETTAGFDALFGLLHVQAHVVRAIDEALERAHDTGITGYEILYRLARMPDAAASVRDLAAEVVVGPSRVSRVADALEQRGLLARCGSPRDGRVSIVRLTAAGEEVLAGLQAAFEAALVEHFLSRLTCGQVAALVDVARALGAPHCGA
jgi:DNA-binding MarR family transcriptional regulator